MSKSKLSNTNRRKQINYCKTCNKIRVIDNEYCDACKLKQYLSGIEEIKAIQSLSSYSILFDNNKVIPNEFKQLEELHKRIAMTTYDFTPNKIPFFLFIISLCLFYLCFKVDRFQ